MGAEPRILVAEDMHANVVLFRAVLQRAGFDVVIALDGEAAVARAAEEAFPLILMDVGLPKIDGLQAAREIRASGGPSAAALIVALTADDDRAMENACADAGMDYFLAKPISPSLLSAKVAELTPLGVARLAGDDAPLHPQRRIA